jgi:hypothetical protein
MNAGTLLATILLAVVSVAHLLRVLFGWQVTIADAIIPVWASVVAALVAGAAAILLWKGSRRRN